MASCSPEGCKSGHGGGLTDLLQHALEGGVGKEKLLHGNLDFFAALASKNLEVSFGGGQACGQLRQNAAGGGVQSRGVVPGVHAGIQRLGSLGAVAVDGYRLDSLTPALGVGLGDLLDAGLVGQVDGLGDGSGEEGLRGGHHHDVAHVMDGARALCGLEAAIEDRQVLGADAGRALDGAGGVDIADDGVDILRRIAELEEGFGDGVVDDLDHAAADQLLVLDQSQVGLDAGGVAVHHEADGAGGGQDCGLGVAIAVLFSVNQGRIPALTAGVDQGVELGHGKGIAAQARSADVVDLGAMHADHVQEGLAVDVEAGASATLVADTGGQRSCRGDWRAVGRHDGRLQVGLAGENGGEYGGHVAAGVGVVGQAHGHQQRPQVGVAQPERADSRGSCAQWTPSGSPSCPPESPWR